MKFGTKLDENVHQPWAEYYISYKRLKRILGKIEVQQNKAKRAAERERERLALDEERQTAQVLTNGASSINAAAGLAHGRDANASPMSMDATPVGSLPQPLTLTRQVAASKYTSPLLRSYGSSERSATPPPPQQAPAGYSVLIDGGDRAGVPFSGASRSSSPVPAFASSSTSVPAGIWSTPPLGQAYAYNTGDGSSQFSTPSLAGVGAGDARPEFFQVIEDDIRRINKFYRERVQALLAEVQGFQDEHRPALDSSAPHLRMTASQMFRTPVDAWGSSGGSPNGGARATLPTGGPNLSQARDKKVPTEDELLLADPNAPDDDLPALAGPPASYQVLGSDGAFPPSSGLPKFDLNASLLFDGGVAAAKVAATSAAPSASVTALLDHRPLSAPVYALYGSTGDLSSLNEEQQKELITSQASRLAREKKLLSVFQELQRLKFLVELNYIGFGKIIKKYEKVTGERMRRAFMQRLDQEEFFRSGEVGSLIQLTETLFYVVSDGRRLAEVAAAMAAPKRAAQAVYIMKPKILLFALALFFILFFAPLLSDANIRAHRCIVLMGIVIVMWVTEAVPYFVTALFIPVLTVVFGILADAQGNTMSAEDASKEVFAKMFDHTVALVLGGFAISAAFSKFQFELHLATYIQSKTADRPHLFIFAFMLLGFVLSMFINNVAAPVLCLAVLLPIIRDLPRESPFARCSLLALAFACNIGGMLTPISSPQNTVSLAELSRQDPAHEISFMGWCIVAVPFGLVLLVMCWVFLIFMLKPNDVERVPEILHAESDSALSTNHYLVLIVSGVTILLWCSFSVTKAFFGDLGVIALLPIVIFFGTGILTKTDFNNFSWNLVYLLGGGNVLGLAVSSSGLLVLITNQIAPQLQQQSEWVVVIAFCGFVAVVTTFVSHTVAAIIIMPVVVKIGVAIGHSQSVLMASALMCSGAMALPMTSFPNINSLLAEDDYGRPYLEVADFLKYGGMFSGATLVLLITLGFGLIKLQFGA